MGYERILLDVEVQRDFFTPGGACYGKKSSAVAARVYDLFEWAKSTEIPVISTVLRLRDDMRVSPDERPFCIEGTDGERKLVRTVLARRTNFGLVNTTDLPGELFNEFQQVIFEKRKANIFDHNRLERFITQLKGGTFIICGASVAGGIVEAAVGLRKRGFTVIVASDAVLTVEDDKAEMARLRMEAKGVAFMNTREIISPRAAGGRKKHRPARPSRPAEKKRSEPARRSQHRLYFVRDEH